MSLVTAISPRAILDVVFVAAQIVRLVRRIAEIYGGRPGLLGLVKLARSIGAHIAITGGMAVGDSLLQQLVGHGIASRISARMGEGVLNGLLTARVGLSALAVCRPMPFSVDKAPGVSEVAPFLFSKGEEHCIVIAAIQGRRRPPSAGSLRSARQDSLSDIGSIDAARSHLPKLIRRPRYAEITDGMPAST